MDAKGSVEPAQRRDGGFHQWGYPKDGWFIIWKIHLEMDDDWGYPYFRKPPYGLITNWFLLNPAHTSIDPVSCRDGKTMEDYVLKLGLALPW